MRVVRDFRKIDLAEVGERSGLSPDWLSMMEAGECYPNLDQAEALARALGVDRLTITGPILDCSFDIADP